MAQLNLLDELLSQQQKTINSCTRSLEEKISQNFQQVQRLVEQGSSNLQKSIPGQVEALIEKEKQNASMLQVLEEWNREATQIAEEQYHRLKEVRLNLTTPLTSVVEASEPNTTLRANLTSVAPNTLPQEAVAQTYSCHSKLRQEQPLEDHAALLRDEIFNVILGTVNTQHGTTSHTRKMKSGSDFGDDEVFHLPQVPDMSIAGSGHGHEVTFRSLVVRLRSVSSTPHLVPQPVSFYLSRIPDTKTSGKDTDSEAEGRLNLGTRSGLTPYQKVKRMSQDASIASHGLQLTAEDL